MTTPPPPRNPEPPATEPTTMARYLWCIREDPSIVQSIQDDPTIDVARLIGVAAMHAAISDVETGGEIFRKQENIGKILNLDRQTIGKYQAHLRKIGYLRVQRREGRKVVHQLVAPVTMLARYQRS